MHKVQVWVELPDYKYRAYVSESRRQGVTVENLVEQMVQGLLSRTERDAREGTDHPIIPK
jgi:hypothetical protein